MDEEIKERRKETVYNIKGNENGNAEGPGKRKTEEREGKKSMEGGKLY